MIDQAKLISGIKYQLELCGKARTTDPKTSDAGSQDRFIAERDALAGYLNQAKDAGTDQTKLEQVLHSMENDFVIKGYVRSLREQCAA